MRQVNMHFSGDKLAYGPNGKSTPYREALLDAIAYLSLWAYNGCATVARVEIFDDGKLDLVAVYWDAEDRRTFVMGAVWRESEGVFSFHS